MSNRVVRRGSNGRLWVLWVVFLFAFGAVLMRQFYVQVWNSAWYLGEGNKRILRPIRDEAFRGMILDREGDPLAVSSPVVEVSIDPYKFFEFLDSEFLKVTERCTQDYKEDKRCVWLLDQSMDESVRRLMFNKMFLEDLALILERDVYELLEDLERYRHRRFVYLTRHFSPNKAEEVVRLKIPYVQLDKRYRRVYPDDELLAQVIGYTNIDDQGLEGLEFKYNDWLSGQQGRKVMLVDRKHQPLSLLREEVAVAQGQSLQLSIDKRIQYLMRRELLYLLDLYQAEGASAVMLDVQTGEILGMLSVPDGNPNNLRERVPSLMKNRVLTDAIEPASIIKPIAIAGALELGIINKNSKFRSGYMYIGRRRVSDIHDYGVMDLSEVLMKSSNVAMAMISKDYPKEIYFNFLRRMGFGSITPIAFPGEQQGYLPSAKGLDDFSYATNFFGYGLSTTLLQIAQAYAILGNDGVKMPLTLLKRDYPVEGERVISSQVAGEVLHMMEKVVEQGTGRRANTESYSVAGKTGTSHKLVNGVYDKTRYRSLFAGLAPASNPRIVLVIMVDDPKGQHYGGVVAAPSFARITEVALRNLGVLPDKLNSAVGIHLELDEGEFLGEENDFFIGDYL